ncbi:phosphoribosyl-AMP cyclohydrolase, partial [Halobacterium salinarum]|nr:phosphoribosyl-AMP cyclohydrolase [Halobacterium salinarum]
MEEFDVDLDFGGAGHTDDGDGLVAVIAQDADSRDVLMLAYATREAVAKTATTGRAHYYSRSR